MVHVRLAPYMSLLTQSLPDDLLKLASGEPVLPKYSLDAPPFIQGGFPPALVPLFGNSGGGAYYGYWRHWFVPRAPTFVNVDIESGFRATEVSRTAEQFKLYVVAKLINLDSPIQGVKRCFAALHIAGTFDALRRTVAGRSWYEALSNRAEFRADPPRGMNPPVYKGDFPSGDSERVACSLEVRATQSRARSGVQQRELCERAIASSRFDEAWVRLNSSAWTFGEARDVILKLASAADQPDFTRFANAWASQDHEMDYPY